MVLIYPRGMSLKQWADAVILDLWRFGPVPRLLTDRDWRDWAADLNLILSTPNIASLATTQTVHSIVLPDPYEFIEWQTWAERVVGIFASVKL